MMPMKLSDWARKMNISYETAWRWKRDGKIPHPIEIIGRTTIVHDEIKKTTGTEIYCPHCGSVIQMDIEVR